MQGGSTRDGAPTTNGPLEEHSPLGSENSMGSEDSQGKASTRAASDSGARLETSRQDASSTASSPGNPSPPNGRSPRNSKASGGSKEPTGSMASGPLTLPYLPGPTMTLDEARKVLSEGSDDERHRLIAAFLSFAPWDEIWAFLTEDEVREVLPHLDLPESLASAWEKLLGDA